MAAPLECHREVSPCLYWAGDYGGILAHGVRHFRNRWGILIAKTRKCENAKGKAVGRAEVFLVCPMPYFLFPFSRFRPFAFSRLKSLSARSVS